MIAIDIVSLLNSFILGLILFFAENIKMTSTFTQVELIEPDYMTVADFERNFDFLYWRKTFREYWVISAYLSVLYLVVVFGGISLMKSRKPFKVDRLLTLWNIGLTIMSIWAFVRTTPEFLHNLSRENGLYHSTCEW